MCVEEGARARVSFAVNLKTVLIFREPGRDGRRGEEESVFSENIEPKTRIVSLINCRFSKKGENREIMFVFDR